MSEIRDMDNLAGGILEGVDILEVVDMEPLEAIAPVHLMVDMDTQVGLYMVPIVGTGKWTVQEFP